VFAVALLSLQAAAPTAEILHEIRHVSEAWESIPTASGTLESAAGGGCHDARPEHGPDGEEHEDDGTCELCGSLAPLRAFSNAAPRVARLGEPRSETVAFVATTPTIRLIATDGDPRGPPSPTS
jgi:hypothetical protein